MGIKKLKKIFLFLILFFISYNLNAQIAEVKLKNRISPVKVKNLRFFYYKSLIPSPFLIVSLKEQRHKYIKFHVKELRKIEFKKLAGGKNFYPTFLIYIYLKRGGHYIKAYNIPLKAITGINRGRKWKLKLELNNLYERNIKNLKEIIFYNEKF